MMSMLNQMEIFYFVATWKSFSRAALELGVSKAYISKQITALEKELGTKLLQRTTRHLTLTEQGSQFFESCNNIIREKQLAQALIKEGNALPLGNLKVTAPPSMCSSFLAKYLPQFLTQYPKINLNIDASSTVKNLFQHGIDIALRITHTPDENLIARLITCFQFIVCTTPRYLKKYGFPKNPENLSRLNCLIYSADPNKNNWPFEIKKEVKIIRVQGNLISSNDRVIKEALMADEGIARLPEYILLDEVASKKLVILFSEYSRIEMPIYAIYASNITIPPKIKFFVNFLKEKLAPS